MKIAREWATPLTIGSFGLLAITGVLMFFHLDSGLNKLAHEWLSWILLLAVGLHVAVNMLSFKRYFSAPRGRWVIGASAVLLALSFIPLRGASSQPPFVAPVKALAAAPLPLLAQVAGVEPGVMRSRLQQAGLAPASDADSVSSLVGGDTKRQVQVLARVLGPAAAPRAGG